MQLLIDIPQSIVVFDNHINHLFNEISFAALKRSNFRIM